MTIDFRKFSLNKTEIRIDRYAGSYVGGIYQRTGPTSTTAWASVQPYDTVDPAQIFEPQVGQWVDEVYWMYINQVIYQNDNENSNPTADLIIVDGVTYRPVRVQKWLHLSNEHYKVLLQRYDGD